MKNKALLAVLFCGALPAVADVVVDSGPDDQLGAKSPPRADTKPFSKQAFDFDKGASVKTVPLALELTDEEEQKEQDLNFEKEKLQLADLWASVMEREAADAPEQSIQEKKTRLTKNLREYVRTMRILEGGSRRKGNIADGRRERKGLIELAGAAAVDKLDQQNQFKKSVDELNEHHLW